MDATAPPKPVITLEPPINIEQSRAQRLQRQQARFRDRGGIFVPTNRGILLDILLGKASPLKKSRRSASASPSRGNEGKSSAGNEVSKPSLRRSPRKQSQKTIDIVTDERARAMTDNSESEVRKPTTKVTGCKSSRSRPQSRAKDPAKSTTKPRDGPEAFAVVEDSVIDTNAKRCSTNHPSPVQKAAKRKVDASETTSLKTSTEKIIPNADDDIEVNIPLTKLQPKGKRVSETKPQEVDGTKGTSKTRGRKHAAATTSTTLRDSNSLKQTEKVETVYSKLSEDDAAYKPEKKASTKKVKTSAALMEKATSKSSSAQKGEVLSSIEQSVPSQLSDIQGEDKECNLEKQGTAPPESVAVVASSKGRKRVSTSVTQNSDLQPRRKCVKLDTTQTDADLPLHKNSKSSGEVLLLTIKKRRRDPEDAESGVEDGVDRSPKRKKRSGQPESRRTPQVLVEEVNAKPVAKRSSKTKVTEPTRRSKKQSSNNATTASKRKENTTSMSKSSKKVKVVSISGPPKSVLERIKDSLGAQVVDNEPDPIDFLS